MEASTGRPQTPGTWLLRMLVAALMLLAGINVFTGAPLLALWVGAKIEGNGDLTMGIVFSVIATLSVALAVLAWALSTLGRAYDRLTGRQVPTTRERAVWLRSMRDEPVHRPTRAAQLSGLEKTLVVTVVLCVLSFEVWFFFFAGSSLPNTT